MSIQQVRTEAKRRFGKRELDAVLHDIGYDPPQYQVSLMELAAGKLYFY